MAKFQVGIMRIGYAHREIEVEADTEDMAGKIALLQARDLNFMESGSEMEVDYIVDGEE
jgi:hypothetical protein